MRNDMTLLPNFGGRIVRLMATLWFPWFVNAIFSVGYAHAEVPSNTNDPAALQDYKSAMNVLNRLASTPLKLSTDSQSFDDQFLIHYLVMAPLPNGDEYGCQGVITRDKRRSAITVRTLDGLFFLYCTEDLCISVDQSNPEVLILQEKGFGPHAIFKFDQTLNKISAQFGASNRSRLIDCDFSSLLHYLIPKIIDAKITKDALSVSLRTAHFGTDIEIFNAEKSTDGIFPIIQWENWGGKAASAVVISPPSQSTVDYFSISKALLVRNHIRFRNLGEGEDFIAGPRPDFGKAPADHRAATLIESLFSRATTAATTSASDQKIVRNFGKDDLLNPKEFLHKP